MYRKHVVILALAAALAGSARAAAFQGPLEALAGFVDRLDLTGPEKEEIRKIFATHKERLVALAAAEKETRTSLVAAIRQPEVNAGAVRLASAAVAQVDADLAVERARIYSEVYAVLTPVQREELESGLTRLREAAASRMGALLSLFFHSV